MSFSVKMGSMGELTAVGLDAHAPPGAAAAVHHMKTQHTCTGVCLSACSAAASASQPCLVPDCLLPQGPARMSRARCFVCCFASLHSSFSACATHPALQGRARSPPARCGGSAAAAAWQSWWRCSSEGGSAQPLRIQMPADGIHFIGVNLCNNACKRERRGGASAQGVRRTRGMVVKHSKPRMTQGWQ